VRLPDDRGEHQDGQDPSGTVALSHVQSLADEVRSARRSEGSIVSWKTNDDNVESPPRRTDCLPVKGVWQVRMPTVSHENPVERLEFPRIIIIFLS
jgi:hypothetical protein